MVTASMVSAKKGYTPAFDLLNIAACISVVILHVNGAIWDFSYGRYWVTSLILECAFYWAVPVFFMLSGATLVDYRERYNTKAFFIHRFSKTLPPFLFWSVVSVFWAVYSQHSLPVDMLTDWRAWIDIIFNTKAMSIYWFFIPLFALYLCIPFISSVPETARIKVFGFAFLYSFISGSCLPHVFLTFFRRYLFNQYEELAVAFFGCSGRIRCIACIRSDIETNSLPKTHCPVGFPRHHHTHERK